MFLKISQVYANALRDKIKNVNCERQNNILYHRIGFNSENLGASFLGFIFSFPFSLFTFPFHIAFPLFLFLSLVSRADSHTK